MPESIKSKPPTRPTDRTETIRKAILTELLNESATARDLSALISIREKDVIAHLEHLRKSLRHTDQRLVIVPAECLSCGFVFAKRQRFSKPGSCPKCRDGRIEPPVFKLEFTK